MFNVYTDVKFTPFVPDLRGISVGITFDAPPGRARARGVPGSCRILGGGGLASV